MGRPYVNARVNSPVRVPVDRSIGCQTHEWRCFQIPASSPTVTPRLQRPSGWGPVYCGAEISHPCCPLTIPDSESEIAQNGCLSPLGSGMVCYMARVIWTLSKTATTPHPSLYLALSSPWHFFISWHHVIYQFLLFYSGEQGLLCLAPVTTAPRKTPNT